jgi:outer membrane immunogenic protein
MDEKQSGPNLGVTFIQGRLPLRRDLIVALATILAMPRALAADLPPRPAEPDVPVPALSWSGPYSGLSVGYAGLRGGGTTSECVTPEGVANGSGCSATPFPQSSVFIPSTASPPVAPGLINRADGPTVGGQVGYNLQVPDSPVVFGIEADGSYTGLTSTAARTGTSLTPQPVGSVVIGSAAFTARESLDYLATLRGRAGYAAGNVLIYGTGGFALGGTALATSFTGRHLYRASASATQTGWVAGGGLEYALPKDFSLPGSASDAVTAKVEAAYFDLGRRTVLGPEAFGATQFLHGARFSTQGLLVRAGLNYHFAEF